MKLIDTSSFIKEQIIKRSESLFKGDLEKNANKLEQSISGKSVLVIGGAGTIGSSYIKALLPFQPSKLVVLDTNENGLTELTRDLRSTSEQYIPEEYITYPMDFGTKVFEKMFLNEGPFQMEQKCLHLVQQKNQERYCKSQLRIYQHYYLKLLHF